MRSAQIELPTIDKSAYVVEGVGTDDLRKGPGHYPDTPLPGEHGTVAIAGHRTTHGAPFRNIDKLKRGDRIVLQMPYGGFVYRVERTQIVDPTALWVTKRVKYDRLVLSACHPLYSAAQRIIVFARFVRRGIRESNAVDRIGAALPVFEHERGDRGTTVRVARVVEVGAVARLEEQDEEHEQRQRDDQDGQPVQRFKDQVRNRSILTGTFYSLRWTAGDPDRRRSTTQVVPPNAERG